MKPHYYKQYPGLEQAAYEVSEQVLATHQTVKSNNLMLTATFGTSQPEIQSFVPYIDETFAQHIYFMLTQCDEWNSDCMKWEHIHRYYPGANDDVYYETTFTDLTGQAVASEEDETTVHVGSLCVRRVRENVFTRLRFSSVGQSRDSDVCVTVREETVNDSPNETDFFQPHQVVIVNQTSLLLRKKWVYKLSRQWMGNTKEEAEQALKHNRPYYSFEISSIDCDVQNIAYIACSLLLKMQDFVDYPLTLVGNLIPLLDDDSHTQQ